MAKTKTTRTLAELLGQAPRYAALIAAEGTRYMGPCVVQAAGAWTRVGPTWLVPGVGWLVIGPGAANWGTKKGLAELATEPGPAPTWHAAGLAIAPVPNLGFAMTADVLASTVMAEVAALTAEAEAVFAANNPTRAEN